MAELRDFANQPVGIRWHFSTFDQLLVPIGSLLEMAAEIIDTNVRKAIQRGPKRTGRKYRVPGRKVLYIASKEGEPPAASATGTLVSGITRSNARQVSKSIWAVEVGSTAKSDGFSYPAHLENPKGLNRPVWLKTFQNKKVQQEIMNIFKNKALRRKVGG